MPFSIILFNKVDLISRNNIDLCGDPNKTDLPNDIYLISTFNVTQVVDAHIKSYRKITNKSTISVSLNITLFQAVIV